MDPAAIERDLQNGAIDFVRFEQTDTHGISRSKTVPARHYAGFSQRGLNFFLGHLGLDVQAGVAPGTGYLEEMGFPDSLARPDPATLRAIPWADRTARVLCDPYLLDGRPAGAGPRYVARRVLKELDTVGYRLLSGFEYEFYVTDGAGQPWFPGIQVFATLRTNHDEGFLYEVMRSVSAMGVDVITANAEYGPGQVEINFAPDWGLEAADQAFTFKNAVKEMAQRRGLMASFMTKPYADQSANGCHYHQSLWRGQQNAFLDPNSPDGLTEVCRQFIAGQLAHAPALTALASPTVNCAKRYKPFSFAPTNATWGVENRTTAIRVKATRDDGTHIENRLGGGSANPYLVLAGYVAAGIDGIRNKLEAPAAIAGIAHGMAGVPDLPASLDEALEALEGDEVLCTALGEEFIHLFLAVKRHEIAKAQLVLRDYGTGDFNSRVDPWERAEYFEFL